MAQPIRDQLTQGVGDAVADIRTKLFEEAWFGRPAVIALDRSPAMGGPQQGRPSEFDEFWAGRVENEAPKPQPERQHENETKGAEPEISPALEEELAIDGLRRWYEKRQIDMDFDIER